MKAPALKKPLKNVKIHGAFSIILVLFLSWKLLILPVKIGPVIQKKKKPKRKNNVSLNFMIIVGFSKCWVTVSGFALVGF
jgi:hypothetical protein